ncbi:MAG: hypothetical protein ABIR68_13410 [Ilumatobacteraceae bacterium]
MAVTSIEARCRRCGDDFHLFEVREQRSGCCPRCGWVLTPDWTAKLLEEAGRADFAQRHLVAALRSLRNLPGNVDLRPHTILRNLFEEVGWEQDLAEDPEMLRDELRELRRLVSAWELLDPVVAAAQPRRSWLWRAIAVMTGVSPAQLPPTRDDASLTSSGDSRQFDRSADRAGPDEQSADSSSATHRARDGEHNQNDDDTDHEEVGPQRGMSRLMTAD